MLVSNSYPLNSVHLSQYLYIVNEKIRILIEFDQMGILTWNYFNSLNMIKKIATTCSRFARTNSTFFYLNRKKIMLFNNLSFPFSQTKKLRLEQIPHKNKQIKAATITLGEEEIDYFKTQGGISILEKVPGVQSQSGELYVLKLKCSECKAQSIKSFTKQAYHKGVVMVKCGGCQKMHLLADNIGWFQDNIDNIEIRHEGKVQKMHDPVAIVRFLQSALGVDNEQKPKSKEGCSSEQTNSK